MSRWRSGRSRTTDVLTAAAPIVARCRRVTRVSLEPKVGRDLAGCDPVRMVRGPIHCFSTDRRSVGMGDPRTGEGSDGRKASRGSRPDAIAALAGLLPATLPATAVTLGPTWWSRWTRAARETLAECPRTTPWTAPRETFNPRVLGSNPSRLTSIPRYIALGCTVSVEWCGLSGWSDSHVDSHGGRTWWTRYEVVRLDVERGR